MKKNSGQAAIVICFSFITLFLLLALSINIGIYINDKINLQNAADAGAYAGASEQARLLQEIGYANYEIRQLYKRFIYDYRYRFSIENDRDPVISPSICITYPFCDCVIRKSKNPPIDGPSGLGQFGQLPVCGNIHDRTGELLVGTHGNPDLVHQLSWNMEEPYDCDQLTKYNHDQTMKLKLHYENEFANLLKAKMPSLVKLINEVGGRAEKIAGATIRANLTEGNRKVEIKFPRPAATGSSLNIEPGPYLSVLQQNSNYRIYYTKWSGPITAPGCHYNGKPNCMYYTCLRHHAGGYIDVNLPGIWYLKNPALTTSFVVLLEREKSDFPISLNLFGKAPKMMAISAAKPFGSSIGWPDKYSQQTVVPELYVKDSKDPYPNQFLLDNNTTVNPSYLDFMEAFYWFDNPEYQSLSGEYMPIPLVAEMATLNRLHFTFDSEAFPGLNNSFDRIRFETSWPYDPQKGKKGRSGYSVKFVALSELGTRYKGQYGTTIPEKNSIDH